MAARQHRQRVWVGAALLLAVLVGAACSPAGEPTPDAPALPAPTPTATRPPVVMPTAAPTTTPPDATLAAGVGTSDLPDVPYEMSGYEIIAARVGDGTYSGYTCVLSPDGCACELPAIQEVMFTFRPDGVLEYHVERDGFTDTWEMLRAAPNQWDYLFAVESEEQEATIGQGRVLLSFTETGYVINQLVNFRDAGLVVCPEVSFRRLPATSEE